MAIIVYMRPIWRRGLEGVLQLKQKKYSLQKNSQKTEKIFRFPPGIPPAGNGQMTLEREKLIEVILRSRDLFFETLSLSDTHNDLGKHSLGNRGEACELGRPHSTAFGC